MQSPFQFRWTWTFHFRKIKLHQNKKKSLKCDVYPIEKQLALSCMLLSVPDLTLLCSVNTLAILRKPWRSPLERSKKNIPLFIGHEGPTTNLWRGKEGFRGIYRCWWLISGTLLCNFQARILNRWGSCLLELMKTGACDTLHCWIRVRSCYTCGKRSPMASTIHFRGLQAHQWTHDNPLWQSVRYRPCLKWQLPCTYETHRHPIPFYSIRSGKPIHQAHLLSHWWHDCRHFNEITT